MLKQPFKTIISHSRLRFILKDNHVLAFLCEIIFRIRFHRRLYVTNHFLNNTDFIFILTSFFQIEAFRDLSDFVFFFSHYRLTFHWRYQVNCAF